MSTTIAPSTETIKSTVLDNGLRVVVKPDSRAPIAVSQIWYRVGSSYEQRGLTGISHLLEHMMFKGTARYPEGTFSEIVSRQGSRENAFTGRDFTAYFEILAADRLPVAFELEADRMANLDIRAETLETEREVVLEERRLRTDDRPEGRFLERYAAVAEAGTAYAHPIIGWSDDINAIDDAIATARERANTDGDLQVSPSIPTAVHDEPEEARAVQRRVRARIIEQIAAWRGVPPAEVDGLDDPAARATNWIDGDETEPDASPPEGEASVKPSTHSGSSEPGG